MSAKYKDYLHTVDNNSNRNNNKSKNKNKKNIKKKPKKNEKNENDDKINDIYKQIQNNLKADEALLRRMERNESCIDFNNTFNKLNKKKKIIPINNKRKKTVSVNKEKDPRDEIDPRDIIDINADINDINNLKNYYSKNKKNNFEDNLFQNGFFFSKNRKDKSNNISNLNDESESQNKEDRINQILEKYKMMKKNEKEEEKKGKDEEINSRSKSKNKINDKNYDYIKKRKGNEEGLFGTTKNSKNYNKNFDQEYDELFHPKKYKRNTNDGQNNKINTSDYSNSVFNLINNLDNKGKNTNMTQNNNFNVFGYDDFVNNINEEKKRRINKKKVSRGKLDNSKNKKLNINSNLADENSFVLAPMKGIPITNISFRARMKYFSDRREKNLEKMKKEKNEEEKQKYTFQPKTGDNSLNVIKYDNTLDNEGNNVKKKKVDYNRINNLYLDYKDKQNKIDELTKEYYKNAGISFVPKISDKNHEMKNYKNKLGQIPYMDRVEIYTANKQPYNAEKNIQFYQTE